MAVTYLGRGKGVPVNLVSRLMHVDPSFVTTHSKLLEKNGLLRHKSSANDARNVQMLTAETRKHLARLAPRQAAQDELAFDECGIDRSSEFIAKAATVRHRLERARSGIKKTKRTTVRNGAR
ncbi:MULTISPECIES: MarR family transcriptional regulator [unclassified Bradyrhizobium]|uniref:MarR family transcriptional regulator n=1 Tax=unclassified Bradyrhizobium TaxID=2631580 RepID=UPI00247A313E|nr:MULTISPECIES: MarR family transcriptional regulator [unclassified Bradyrhizobium]WGR73250.1 MarR family transcriptional regulator [Bradyrhizobium sp. ISRA426]WGR78087.1 MarR family transcriptional regulator [Bradyrhizobium sp. ISRA430]WGR88488.1 MarR family transcriptional regulator [Bradyrhizobium sp. ISRA432]